MSRSYFLYALCALCVLMPPIHSNIIRILLRLERKIDGLVPRDMPVPLEEEWLTVQQVKELLFIEERTFYRLKRTKNWVTKKAGKQLLYLKSSL